MKLSDIELKELSQLVYLDIPKKLHENLIRYGELDFGDFINHYKTYPEDYEGKCNEKEKLYYKSLLDKYSEPKYKDVVIKGYVNSNKTGSGYASLALDTGNGNIAIVNRGSESPGADVDGDLSLGDSITQQWKDWIDNAETAGKITAQQKEALSFVKELVNSGNFESVQLGGHSKGGNLALFIAIAADEELRKKISDVATINAPGFRDSFIKDYKKVIDELNKNGVLRTYITEYDYVSRLMFSVSKNLILKFQDENPYGENFFDLAMKGTQAHFIYNTVDSDGNFIVGEIEDDLFAMLIREITRDLTGTYIDKELIATLKNITEIVVYQEIMRTF